MSRCCVLALASILFLATPLRADLTGAQEAYRRGMQFEKAKDYHAAISEYEGALLAEPRYVYAYKQIGTCKYYLGDKAGALEAYDQYLAKMPNDAAIKNFADKLRTQGVQAASTGSGKPALALGQATRFNFDVSAGYHSMSFAHWNQDWADTIAVIGSAGSTPPEIVAGYSLGVAGGYRVNPKLKLLLNLDYFMTAAGLKISGGSGSVTSNETLVFNYPLLYLGGGADYELAHLDNGLKIDAGLRFGYGMLSGAQETDTYSLTIFGVTSISESKSSLSGSGLGFELKLGADWPISSNASTFLDLGYRVLSLSKIAYQSTTTASGVTTNSSGTYKRFGPNAGANPPDLDFDYSGLDFKIGVRFAF